MYLINVSDFKERCFQPHTRGRWDNTAGQPRSLSRKRAKRKDEAMFGSHDCGANTSGVNNKRAFVSIFSQFD
jgi:hypothetical protein